MALIDYLQNTNRADPNNLDFVPLPQGQAMPMQAPVQPVQNDNGGNFFSDLLRSTTIGQAMRRVNQQDALRQLSQEMQSGNLDKEQALMKYAGITGDYGNVFRPQNAANMGGATGALVDRLMQENPNMSFADALGQVQTGFRRGVMFEGGQVVPIEGMGGALGQLAGQEAYGKTSGQLEAEGQLRPDIERDVETAKAKATQSVTLSGVEAKKSGEANTVLEIVAEAEKLLPDASGSYIDMIKSQGKRVVGTSDEETQANSALKVLSGRLVASMPRMEGPQSDKDVQMYKDMAANISDPTVPAGDKKAALQALRQLQAKYADINNETNIIEEPVLTFNPLTGELE